MPAPLPVEQETTSTEERPLHIKFHFHPHQPTVAKAQGDSKSRYLYGITSGPRVDGHGERMTADCIKDFVSQAQSGDILLYPSVHGIRDIDDIGRLVDCSIDEKGDWVTTYRLYGPEDGVGQATLDKCDKLWKQINGLPPYTKARQKGFSIEGNVRPGGIVYQSAQGQRVLNAIDLDGVVVVPRPAYKDSMAHAVFKALGEQPPWQVQKAVQKSLQQKLQIDNLENQYYRQKYKLHDALQAEIMNIMTSGEPNTAVALTGVFDEYKQLMIELIVQSAPWFLEQAKQRLAAGVNKALITRNEPGEAMERGRIFATLAECIPPLQAMVERVGKAAKPEGSISQRADGQYKKTNGEWVKVPKQNTDNKSPSTGGDVSPVDKLGDVSGEKGITTLSNAVADEVVSRVQSDAGLDREFVSDYFDQDFHDEFESYLDNGDMEGLKQLVSDVMYGFGDDQQNEELKEIYNKLVGVKK